MTGATALRWIEGLLVTLGMSLGAWSVAQIIEARAGAQMPIPKPPTSVASEISSGVVIPARGGWVARLEAPSVGLSATVLEGSDDATLARGAGHIEYTPFPGQPGNGNIGIAGHRDTTFRAVRHLQKGDPLELRTSDRVYRYLITATSIVDPEDVHVLDPQDRPLLTLVTCYPFEFIGHAPRRYIIHAELTSSHRVVGTSD
jgi:LPXTG-site transpeptidase (sortase) family protein